MEFRTVPRPGQVIASALRRLFRPPFLPMLAIAVLATLVSNTLSAEPDLLVALASILLLSISIFVDIGIALAAAEPEPDPSADVWIRRAFRRRCFWRYVIAGLLALGMSVLGAIGLLIGAFVIGAFVGLAQVAAALERANPFEALSRSVELGRGVRWVVGVPFGLLVFAPSVSIQVLALLGALGGGALLGATLVSVTLTSAGTIALAQVFVALGGRVVPEPARRSADGGDSNRHA